MSKEQTPAKPANSEDDVLRRMLSTPPDPKVKPQPAPIVKGKK